jgi:hypothetical protein
MGRKNTGAKMPRVLNYRVSTQATGWTILRLAHVLAIAVLGLLCAAVVAVGAVIFIDADQEAMTRDPLTVLPMGMIGIVVFSAGALGVVFAVFELRWRLISCDVDENSPAPMATKVLQQEPPRAAPAARQLVK